METGIETCDACGGPTGESLILGEHGDAYCSDSCLTYGQVYLNRRDETRALGELRAECARLRARAHTNAGEIHRLRKLIAALAEIVWRRK